jgi:hypothetical protein
MAGLRAGDGSEDCVGPYYGRTKDCSVSGQRAEHCSSTGKTKIDFRENSQAGFVAVIQWEQNLSEAE